MINDDDFVGLAEDCINICDVLWAGVERKNIDDLSNSVKGQSWIWESASISSTLLCEWAEIT